MLAGTFTPEMLEFYPPRLSCRATGSHLLFEVAYLKLEVIFSALFFFFVNYYF